MTDQEWLIEQLDVAIDALLAARIRVGGELDHEQLPLPGDGLDEALRVNHDHEEARQDLAGAIDRLLGAVEDNEELRLTALQVEECAHALAACAAGVGWRLALAATRRKT